jgi:group I intron endonuclease
MIIYKATNNLNGKYYIGKTTATLEKRKKSHRLASKKKVSYFYNAINKYGFENFTWEILAKCTNINELNRFEREFIANNIDGYNIAKGDDGGDTFSNNPNKDNFRKKISNFHSGKKLTQEHKTKISEAHKGMKKPWASQIAEEMGKAWKNKKREPRVLSEETKKKISESNKGKKKIFSEEHKKKLSESNKGKKKNPYRGKTYEEIMGVEKAKELKKKQSLMRKGKPLNKRK